MDLTEVSVLDALDHWASETPENAFIQWRDEAPQTYVEFHERTRRLAGGLRELGVAEGDTVLVMLPNGLEIVYSWLACNALGAIEVPVNTFLRGAFLQHILEDSQAAVMIVDAASLPHLASLDLPERLRTLVVAGDDAPVAVGRVPAVAYETVLASAPIAGLRKAEFSDLSAIFYTSGTTGPAKGIMFTYGQGCVSARNYLRAAGAGHDDVFFCCMPLFHSNAQILQIAAPLMAGARISIWPEFSASRWLNEVRSVGATVSNMLGVMTEFVYRQPARDDDADNPLRILQTVPAPAAIVGDFERRFGVTCIDGYGLTDAGMVAFRRHDEPLVPGSSGRPVDDFEVVIGDPVTDVQLPVGTVGEILIRPRVPFGFMRGYWRRPDVTVEAWRNLWFHTGDAGMIDEDGNLHFRDRMGDSIRVRGENISSSEIEAVLNAHPSVRQCAAVAVTAEIGDYDILVAVVPAPGASIDPGALLRYCEGRMPYYAVPRYVDILSSLPMTATQKVRKVELRQRGVGPSTWDRMNEGYSVPRA
ncbi:ATP-dependent acyl-CoA ligase [Amycolatopsis endophytica]|uniref:Crotonobetaine/carnitine-CoA ligase n=1 Tax=Amycolatopsis endophytica TaxID=860233 RepID=A0A853B406_9PSEU|nr:AMP-binding protein [Amycolatopsis endophytica]NYI89903.1 crotonobetaine/carnitine-CoA ligase [Amycolatopsis endophytica]